MPQFEPGAADSALAPAGSRVRRAVIAIAPLLAIVIVYLFIAIPQLGHQPLWLDEIIDLHQIRDFSLRDLLRLVPYNAGGVPLSYFARATVLHVFGYSPMAARAPSLACSLLAAAGVFVLARRVKMRAPALAVVIFCLLPIQLRYAIESRPYAWALAVSVWGTIVFCRQLSRPVLGASILYGLLAALALYTQPFAIFVFVSHIAFLCFAPAIERRRTILWSAIPLAAAAALFLPWQLHLLSLWSAGSQLRDPVDPLSASSLGVLSHELVGGGYWGTAAIALGALAGIWRGAGRIPHERLFWSAYLLVPVILALAADRLFGYFFAARQLIAITVPLAILTAAAIESVLRRHRRTGLALGLSLILFFGASDILMFAKPHEDWNAAARLLSQYVHPQTCVVFMPPDSAQFYLFFAPELAQSRCPETLPATVFRVLLATAPYASPDTRQQHALAGAGFRQVRRLPVSEPAIDLYERSAALAAH